jgi:hypothetical protein
VLTARSGHKQTPAPQQTALLFDYLVGAAEQRERHGEPERLGGPQVDDQLDFRELLDRQVRRPLALQNSAGVDAGRTV